LLVRALKLNKGVLL